MKRLAKAVMLYLMWAVLAPVILVFPSIPFALMRWSDERWPT